MKSGKMQISTPDDPKHLYLFNCASKYEWVNFTCNFIIKLRNLINLNI